MIRTRGNPLRSRPSAPLVATILAAIAVGVALPATGLGQDLGFTPLPPAFFAFLAAATATYLLLVELAKRRFMGAMVAKSRDELTSINRRRAKRS